jgi:hypothetical protein
MGKTYYQKKIAEQYQARYPERAIIRVFPNYLPEDDDFPATRTLTDREIFSNGETRPEVWRYLSKIKNSLIILDDIRALDYSPQMRELQTLNTQRRHNCNDIIAAFHSIKRVAPAILDFCDRITFFRSNFKLEHLNRLPEWINDERAAAEKIQKLQKFQCIQFRQQ